MNKKAVVQLFQDEIARLTKSISQVMKLDTTKIYKVRYSIFDYAIDPFTNKMVWCEKETCSFIGKLKSFNKESVRFIALGIQKVKGTQFETSLRRQDRKKNLEVSINYRHLDSIEEWKNLETPQLEAAFLVNYEFLTQEFKKRCFNL